MADNEFDMQTAISILERMQNDFLQNTSSGEVSAVEGTFAFDSLSANSIEFEKAYAEMSLMMDAAFPKRYRIKSCSHFIRVTLPEIRKGLD